MASDRKNDPNSFMGSPEAQVAMYGIAIVFCLVYAIGGIRELMTPDANPALVESIGEFGYYALTICRVVVLGITGIAFARIAYKVYRDRRDDS